MGKRHLNGKSIKSPATVIKPVENLGKKYFSLPDPTRLIENQPEAPAEEIEDADTTENEPTLDLSVESSEPVKKANAINESKRREFNDIVRDLRKLALPELPKAERLQLEVSKIRAIGGKVSKALKAPLPVLLRRRERARIELEKQKEMDKQSGVKTTNRKYIDVNESIRIKNEKMKRIKRKRNISKLKS